MSLVLISCLMFFLIELSFNSYWWLFILTVFLVKLPLFILHLWLPKAHVEAPLLGSMILAGVLLNLGGYGVFKSLVYFYFLSNNFYPFFIIFSIFGSFLIGLICIRQVDINSLVAYSSVVHIGPVFCSFLVASYPGVLGGYWIIVSHGLCSSCLFFLLNLVYIGFGSRSLFILRGGVLFLPILSYFWFFFCVSNMGCPPTFNFFSEVFLILGVLNYNNFFSLLFLGLLIVSGFYSILMYLFFNHGSFKLNFGATKALNINDFLVLFIPSFILFFFPLTWIILL